jgi:hypothetical protein
VSEFAITCEFPQPDRLVRHAFGQLRVAQFGSEEDKRAQLGDINPADLPRPWDPPSCPAALRKHVWVWLDRVAAWINHEYQWRHDKVIPACWVAHPHIAHELAVIATLRYNAGFALQPDSLEEWHRYALPGFLDRMAARLAPSPCPPGRHTEWPAGSRFQDSESAEATTRRGEAFRRDQAYSPPGRGARTNGSGPGEPQLTVISSRATEKTKDTRDE